MAIDASLINRAIKGLEEGNVWIALNRTSTGIQVIPKDSCHLRCLKKLLRRCGWNHYGHLNSWHILQHLKTRDWSAVDPDKMDHFYALFEHRIHHKYNVTSLKPRRRQQEISHREEIQFPRDIGVKEDSPISPLIGPLSPQPSVTEIDEEGNTQLHRAVLFRQRVNIHPQETLSHVEQKITALLKQEVDPTIQNNKGDTILHLIADLPYWGAQHDQLVRMLLRYGAKANVPNKQGETAFHLIIAANPSASIVKTLIEEGLADVNAQDNKGDAALHKVAYSDRFLGSFFNTELARALLKHGAKVDMPNKKGNTPLHVAIIDQMDVTKAVRFFCDEAHANVTAQNQDGDTPLHLFAGLNQWDKWNHRKTVELLLSRGADKTLVNKNGELPIHKAYTRSGSEVVDLLETEEMQVADSNGQTPLHLAAKDSRRDIEAFKRIFAKSKDVHAVDKWGNTVLHNAAESGFYEAVEFLIEKGFPVNASNAEGNSPLYLVVWSLLNESYKEISSHSKLKRMEKLITVLDSAKTGSSKKVRFQIDLRFENLHNNVLKRIINLLLDNGADPYQKNKKEESSVEHCFNWAKTFFTF